MSVGRKLLSKWVAGAFQSITGGPVSSLTALTVASETILAGLNVGSDATIRQLTGNTHWTGVATIADGGNSVVISTAAISDDRPIFLSLYKPQNPASLAIVSVDSVVDGTSFAIRSRADATSAMPVSWMVVR